MLIKIGQVWVSSKRVKYKVIQKVQHKDTGILYWKLETGSNIRYCTLEGNLIGNTGPERLLFHLAYSRPKVVKPPKPKISPEEQRKVREEEMKKHNDSVIRKFNLKKGK